MRIFTEAFFRLSGGDQAAVVTAHLYSLENTVGCLIDPRQEPSLRRQIRRFVAKAMEYGLLVD